MAKTESIIGKEAEKNMRTILVVDDDPAVTRAMSFLISRAGFRVLVSRTAADALEKADEHTAAAVIDIHLPDFDGLSLSQRLREKLGPKVPIVILSGDNSIETLRALPDAGATSFFAKPVNGGRLVEHLKEWLGAEEVDSDRVDNNGGEGF